jgi:hypothetical protein
MRTQKRSRKGLKRTMRKQKKTKCGGKKRTMRRTRRRTRRQGNKMTRRGGDKRILSVGDNVKMTVRKEVDDILQVNTMWDAIVNSDPIAQYDMTTINFLVMNPDTEEEMSYTFNFSNNIEKGNDPEVNQVSYTLL